MLDPTITPLKLNLKKDEKLEIEWQDGRKSVYPISLLRTMCPCAACKDVRKDSEHHADTLAQKQPDGSLRLNVLPGNFAKPLHVVSAQLVGNYALRIEWSDQHDTGIYSFQYLRDISPQS